VWTFFGLNDEYLQAVYNQLFDLKYFGGWSFFESYNLPIRMRVWFLEKLHEQKTHEVEQMKAAQQSTRGGRGRQYT